MVNLYDPAQLADSILKYRHNVDSRIQWGTEDDFLYTIVGAMPYENEGTFAVVAGRGGQITMTSGAVAGNRARINLSVTQLPIDPTKDTYTITRGGTLQSVNVRHFVGMYDALPTAAAPPVEPANGCYFRRNDAGAAVNWFAVCRKAGVETAVDTTILGDLLNHDFKIVITNGIAQFYIDGTLRATISTNVPVVAMTYGMVTVTQEAVAKALQLDALLMYNSR